MKQEYLNFAIGISKKAGEIMKEYFSDDNGQTYKVDNTIVTIADKKINSYLIEQVKSTYPTHCVDGEEEQFGKSSYVWVCDPIDGTAMYARHIPVAVFSLALVVDGIPIIGVVYDVFTNNLYTAIKGNGAYKNGKKISVNDYLLDDMKSVAQGNFTLALFPGTTHKNCDIAAVKLIVEEAGGIVTDLFGNEQRYDQDINGAIISNKVVYAEVLDKINKYLENKKTV